MTVRRSVNSFSVSRQHLCLCWWLEDYLDSESTLMLQTFQTSTAVKINQLWTSGSRCVFSNKLCRFRISFQTFWIAVNVLFLLRSAAWSPSQLLQEKSRGDERRRRRWCSRLCRFQAQLLGSGSMRGPDRTAHWNGYKLDSLSPNHQSQLLNVFPFSPNICSQTVDK